MSRPQAVVRIFESELEILKQTVAASPDLETGGELLGLWSHADAPTVMLAGVTVMLAATPGPKSRRGPTTFEQDVDAHMALERLVWERFGAQVVGMWHSHHHLPLHELSGGDVRRTQEYSTRHGRPRYSEILTYFLSRPGARESVIGLRPYVYDDAASGRALSTTLEVLPGISPVRTALLSGKLSSTLRPMIDVRSSSLPVRHVVEDHGRPTQLPHDQAERDDDRDRRDEPRGMLQIIGPRAVLAWMRGRTHEPVHSAAPIEDGANGDTRAGGPWAPVDLLQEVMSRVLAASAPQSVESKLEPYSENGLKLTLWWRRDSAPDRHVVLRISGGSPERCRAQVVLGSDLGRTLMPKQPVDVNDPQALANVLLAGLRVARDTSWRS